MQNWTITLADAIIGGAASALLLGIGWVIRLLIKMDRALSHLSGSTETIYRIWPFITKALRHQNGALKEAGANGSVEKANACLDEVERILDGRHAVLEGQLGTPTRRSDQEE